MRHRAWESIGRELDRDTLTLPDVLIDSFDIDVDVALRPFFDGIANGAGLELSPYYND